MATNSAGFNNWRLFDDGVTPAPSGYGVFNWEVKGNPKKYTASYAPGSNIDQVELAHSLGQVFFAGTDSQRTLEMKFSFVDVHGNLNLSMFDKSETAIGDGSKYSWRFSALKPGEDVFVRIALPSVAGTTKLEQIAGQRGLSGEIAQDEANFLIDPSSDGNIDFITFPHVLAEWQGDLGLVSIEASVSSYSSVSNATLITPIEKFNLSASGGFSTKLGLYIAT